MPSREKSFCEHSVNKFLMYFNPCIYCYPLSCFRAIKQYKKKKYKAQCCGSGSGSRRGNMTHKNGKKTRHRRLCRAFFGMWRLRPPAATQIEIKERPSVADPDPYWTRSQSGQWIKIRIRFQNPDQGGQEWQTKVGKNLEISCFEVPDVRRAFFNMCRLRPPAANPNRNTSKAQRWGSGSVLDPESTRSVDLSPDPYSDSGPRRARMALKSRYNKIYKISCFEVPDVLFWELKASFVTWMSLWRPRNSEIVVFLIRKL